MPVDPRLNPPADYGWGWWVAIVVCLLALVVLAWWTRRALIRPSGPDPTAVTERLRVQVLKSLDGELLACETRQNGAAGAAFDPVLTLDVFSRLVRRFVGLLGDANGADGHAVEADFATLPELRRAAVKDVRLQPVVAWLEEVQRVQFAPPPPSGARTGEVPALETVRRAHRTARELVLQWH